MSGIPSHWNIDCLSFSCPAFLVNPLFLIDVSMPYHTRSPSQASRIFLKDRVRENRMRSYVPRGLSLKAAPGRRPFSALEACDFVLTYLLTCFPYDCFTVRYTPFAVAILPYSTVTSHTGTYLKQGLGGNLNPLHLMLHN